MLSVLTNNRELIQILASAFPEGEFDAVTFKWSSSGIVVDAVSEGRDLLCHMQALGTAFSTNGATEEGMVCVLTANLCPLLGHVLSLGTADPRLKAQLALKDRKTLQFDIDVEGWGRRESTLRHVPDALIAHRPRTRFDDSVEMVGQPHTVIRTGLSAIAPAKIVTLRLSKKEVAFVDASSPDDKFLSSNARANGQVVATYLVPSVLNATKVADRANPESSGFAIASKGLARLQYQFASATLEYLIAPVIGSE